MASRRGQRRVSVQFETTGTSQYERQMVRAGQANIAYGRSLPIQRMAVYRQQLRATTQEVGLNTGAQEQFRTMLIRTEQQTKRSRLGFTQFRKALNAKEVSRYATEVGRLDHLLGSTNRTLRVTNQRLADKGFSRLGLENVTNVSKRHLRELQRTRAALRDAFDSKAANDYIRSLREVENSLRQITLTSRNLQQYSIPTLRRGGRVDTRRISRDFNFSQRGAAAGP